MQKISTLYTIEFGRLIYNVIHYLTLIFYKSNPKCAGASIAARVQTTFFGLPIICYRGVGRVCFLPPLFCPTKFVKSSDQFFERKARRRRKNFEVPFIKKLTFLGKFNGF